MFKTCYGIKSRQSGYLCVTCLKHAMGSSQGKVDICV